MKELKTFILVALFSAACFSCSKDDSPEKDIELSGKGMLAIGVSETGNTKSSAGTSFELENLKTAIISIEKDGAVLDGFNSKEVQLENWGDNSFTIKGVDLDNGDGYAITGFLLKNEDRATTFASPVDGSLAAAWVQEALPISFKIAVDETTQIDIQVVTTLGSKPQDFGYSSLSFSDKTPNVQSYLKNIETFFLDKNEKIVHHFTQRGIPTYSEIYRNHAVNKNITLDFIGQTIKHYYPVDGSLPEKITVEDHTRTNTQPTVDYFFTEHYESGNIKKIKNNLSLLTLNEEGFVTKNESLNATGVATGHIDYLYNEDDYITEYKYYNVDGSFSSALKLTVDSDGNALSRIRFNQDGEILYPKYESEYTNGLEVKLIRIELNENDEETESFVYDFEYNSENLLVRELQTQIYEETQVNTIEYNYSGNNLTSSTSTSQAYSYTTYYDEIGRTLYDDKEVINVLDYKGRLLERQYEDDGYNVVEIFDLYEELMEKKFYDSNEKLVKKIDNSVVIKYWENGHRKFMTSFAVRNMNLIESFSKTDFEYHHPTQKEQFELLSYVGNHFSYDENGVKLADCQIRWQNNSEYSEGIEIHVYENQYEKVDGKLSATKRVTSIFSYSQGDRSLRIVNTDDLYQYVVVTEDLLTGDITSKYYDAQGTEF
ncbi:hypothetical protein [Labilibaculum antarcticum]|uniref:Uncharacterized protein n=1 Tax=Labilibaculum antarcticum TaxID=1717717 RepID=A0A1Y1CPP4_9BACT|nr:hypothetical protein [Labilibaculum antarcticum]BAX82429.1 hypothetical protein ALGA_4138 [Labilibaculum antarcticum]